MDLHESGEMYLETILMLKNKNEYVRSIDIAHEMNFSKPSVSRAIKILKESQLITVDQKGYIDFTDKGRQIAEKVYNRHTTLTDFCGKYTYNLTIICKNVVYYHQRILGGIIDDNSRFG